MTLFEQPGPWSAPPRPPRRRRTGVLIWISVLVGLVVIADVASGSQVSAWVSRGAAEVVGGWTAPEPIDDVVELADRMLLTEDGRRIFYDARPEFLDAEGIAEACNDVGGAGAAQGPGWAGCYTSTSIDGHVTFGRIHILRPADPHLAEEMITTGAHELLHAVYARLDERERSLVDGLVADEVARLPADDPVHAQIASSMDGDESSRGTEQFAYLGSQIMPAGGFDPELERIYARTFADRAALVAYAWRA